MFGVGGFDFPGSCTLCFNRTKLAFTNAYMHLYHDARLVPFAHDLCGKPRKSKQLLVHNSIYTELGYACL